MKFKLCFGRAASELAARTVRKLTGLLLGVRTDGTGRPCSGGREAQAQVYHERRTVLWWAPKETHHPRGQETPGPGAPGCCTVLWAAGACAHSPPTQRPRRAQAGHAWGQQLPPTALWLLLCWELLSQAVVSQGEVRTLVASSDGENQLSRSPKPRLLLSQGVKPVFSEGLYEANIHSSQPPALLATTLTQLSALQKLAVIFKNQYQAVCYGPG